ncbi:RagB/SusD family nutrient uptake outer membrane protein [Ulvibacter antarcticus]|uniref:RagB/SusD domain-containing protein n=1 Tax=Ulvibacter antarcticus TaxID=442714 RepID=A0A3L9YZX5_9FLAO|nr:RagB/SusD family nutrient uptake outer membrane protein [Ulvibacter antarcticus]RMA66261.1 RagB/SusD domain-containing protein [Ulvibacter antarcticus]
MKKYLYKIMFFALVLVTTVSCEVEEFSDLNNAEVDAFEENLTRGDLQDLVGGLLYSSRLRLGTYYDDCGVIGREFYRFSGSDPRFTGDLLGGGELTLDNNTFYITAPWASRYLTVKNANLILGFLDGQDTSAQFTTAEVNATKGLLKTFIAYELLLNLNLTYENGIRLDVADENNLGPFVGYNQSLTGIRALLVEAASDLSNGGSDFPFILSSGFSLFNTPGTFLQANNAIAARVATYQGDASATLAFLNNSFMVMDSEQLNLGMFYTFSLDQTDIANPLFFSIEGLSAANARIAQPNFVPEAETGDNRLSKVVLLDDPIMQDDLSGNYALFRYTSNVDDIPIVRNEELILLYAEANITINPSETVNALNLIRNSAGLPNYTGTNDPTALTNEMLTQRRYSLFAEGHRWIDMRRYNKLGDLPIDRTADDVWVQFPIPLTENQ